MRDIKRPLAAAAQPFHVDSAVRGSEAIARHVSPLRIQTSPGVYAVYYGRDVAYRQAKSRGAPLRKCRPSTCHMRSDAATPSANIFFPPDGGAARRLPQPCPAQHTQQVAHMRVAQPFCHQTWQRRYAQRQRRQQDSRRSVTRRRLVAERVRAGDLRRSPAKPYCSSRCKKGDVHDRSRFTPIAG